MSKANIFEKLLMEIGNPYGVCGLMGNIQAESNFRSDNAQNSYISKMGLTDAQYTQKVDDGTYTNFAYDGVGYGLCQWTSAGRKEGLYNYAKTTGRSISDENMQIEWLIHELNVAYKKVMNGLKAAKSVKDASNLVVLEFERPASVGKNASEGERKNALTKRQAYGEAIYNEFCTTKEEKTFKVCIDAGHFAKYNRCPNNPNYFESVQMWKLHLLQKKYLESFGVEVITTRQTLEKDLNLTTRGKMAKGCDLSISNHTNAVGSGMNESVDYVAVYHLTADNSTDADDRSIEFANALAPVIAEVMGTKQGFKVLSRKADYDRNGDGMMNDNYYAVLHGARLVGVPALILEHSFHTNSKSVEWLLDDANLDKLARAEAEVIAKFASNLPSASVPTSKPTNTSTDTQKRLYRVQAGAFSVLERAEALRDRLIAAGFDAIIVKANGLYKTQIGAYGVKSNAEKMLVKVKAAGFDTYITTNGNVGQASVAKKSNEEVAKEVIKGLWGNGADRKANLTAAGYDYNLIQRLVNSMT